MEIEYEATFLEINKEEVREKLRENGARMIKKEFLMKREVFDLPKGHEIRGGWLRIRDEGDKITMSLKIIEGNVVSDNISNQKEVCLEIDNFENARIFLEKIGCIKKAYQESKRELWELDNVEITIDEWPFLEPFIEIEGKNEEDVKKATKKLGFNYKDAFFGSADFLYAKKYGVHEDIVNDTPIIVFEEKNPFN